jgi:purine-nucleoside phosphorylase
MSQTAPNEFSRQSWPESVRELEVDTALVLGSGLGSFVDCLEIFATVNYEDVKGLPVSKVPGHEGRFVFGKLGKRVLLVAQGRVHLYEGHRAADVCAGVRLMAAIGAKRLVLTNAAGSANRDFPPGEWMAISDHLNLTGQSPLTGGANFFDMSAVYSPALRERFLAVARETGVPMHVGVYAGNLGPQYETPAEVKMAQTFGADAVGMSTVLEAIQARALGMEIAGFSCLTNWAAGLSGQEITHQEVLDLGQSAAGKLAGVLEVVLGG